MNPVENNEDEYITRICEDIFLDGESSRLSAKIFEQYGRCYDQEFIEVFGVIENLNSSGFKPGSIFHHLENCYDAELIKLELLKGEVTLDQCRGKRFCFQLNLDEWTVFCRSIIHFQCDYPFFNIKFVKLNDIDILNTSRVSNVSILFASNPLEKEFVISCNIGTFSNPNWISPLWICCIEKYNEADIYQMILSKFLWNPIRFAYDAQAMTYPWPNILPMIPLLFSEINDPNLSVFCKVILSTSNQKLSKINRYISDDLNINQIQFHLKISQFYNEISLLMGTISSRWTRVCCYWIAATCLMRQTDSASLPKDIPVDIYIKIVNALWLPVDLPHCIERLSAQSDFPIPSDEADDANTPVDDLANNLYFNMSLYDMLSLLSKVCQNNGKVNSFDLSNSNNNNSDSNNHDNNNKSSLSVSYVNIIAGETMQSYLRRIYFVYRVMLSSILLLLRCAKKIITLHQHINNRIVNTNELYLDTNASIQGKIHSVNDFNMSSPDGFSGMDVSFADTLANHAFQILTQMLDAWKLCLESAQQQIIAIIYILITDLFNELDIEDNNNNNDNKSNEVDNIIHDSFQYIDDVIVQTLLPFLRTTQFISIDDSKTKYSDIINRNLFPNNKNVYDKFSFKIMLRVLLGWGVMHTVNSSMDLPGQLRDFMELFGTVDAEDLYSRLMKEHK